MAVGSATETWTGADGNAWPAQWVTGTNYGSNIAATIQNNRGQLNFGDTVYGSIYALLHTPDVYTDTDVTLTIAALPSHGNVLISICATEDGNDFANNGYTLILYCFGNGIGGYQFKRADGANTNSDLLRYTDTSAPDVPYKVRLNRTDATIRFKIWPASDTEPSEWSFSVTDSEPVSAGRVRLGLQYSDNASAFGTMLFDNLSVTGTIYTPPTYPLVYHGINTVSSIKLGTQDVSKIYLGYNKIYPYPTGKPSTLPQTMPTEPVTSGIITWIPSYSNDFTVDAPVGAVRATYPDMGYYDNFADTSNLGIYSPDKVLSAHDSYLDFYLHTENGQPLVACVLPDNYTPRTSVRVSMRYKTITDGVGYKYVGIMWPSSDNWNQGEIDWPEGDLENTSSPANAIPGTYGDIGPGKMSFSPAVQKFAQSDSSDWHISTLEWTPDYINFYWDEQLVYTETDVNKIPTNPMRVTMQAETYIGQGSVPAATTGHVLVDWIVIYDEQATVE